MPSRIDSYSNGASVVAQTISNLKKSALHPVVGNTHAAPSTERKHELLDKFVQAYEELEAYKYVHHALPRPPPFMPVLTDEIIHVETESLWLLTATRCPFRQLLLLRATLPPLRSMSRLKFATASYQAAA